MNVIGENLLPDESLIYQTREHWIVFWLPTLFLSVAIWLFFTNAAPLGAVVMIWAIVLGVGYVVGYVTAEFSVTNKRVFIYYGCTLGTDEKTREIFLEDIESVRVKQGIWGRILGYGTLEIIGPGITGTRYQKYNEELVDFGTIGSRRPARRSKTRLHQVIAPLEFQKEIEKQVERIPVGTRQREAQWEIKTQDGQELGTHDASTIIQLIQEGKIQQRDLVRSGDGEWQSLKDSPLMNKFAICVLFDPIGAYINRAARIGALVGVLFTGLVVIPGGIAAYYNVSTRSAVFVWVFILICAFQGLRRSEVVYLGVALSALALLLLFSDPGRFSGVLLLVVAFSSALFLIVSAIAGAVLAGLIGALIGLIKRKSTFT